MRGPVLCLSPHLDDAALSLGATLHALADGGAEVVVATVFSAATGVAAARWAERQEEDRAALAQLGCRAVHLGLLDAPFRREYFRTFHAIAFGADPAKAEDRAAVLAALRALLGGRELAGRPRRLLCPLGVGRHIDHRHVFSAARALQEEGDLDGIEVAFYEDRPYAFVPGAVPARLRELCGDGLEWALGKLPFLGRYMIDEGDRAQSLAALRAHLGAAPAPGPLRPRRSRPGPEALAARDAALGCYRSQGADLFGAAGPAALYAACGGDEEVLWAA